MARRKHKIEYDRNLDEVLDPYQELPIRDDRNRDRRISYTPSRRPLTARVNRRDHKIEVDLQDDEPLTDRELDELIVDSIDEMASRRLTRVTPILGVRDRKKCEQAKAARRAAAFKSGRAGKNIRPGKPRRKYRC